MTNTAANPDYFGHRARVRKKFLQSLGQELSDYELLEILLFSARPRQDTKALAKSLLSRFGNISAVVNADTEELKTIEGVGEAMIVQIKITAVLIQRILRNSACQKPILSNWQAVLDYATALLKDLHHEVFCVLFLDKKHRLIEEELMSTGDSDWVFVSAKAVAKRALLLSASSVILLHNHPSGDLRPSAADIKLTNEIIAALKNLEIKVIDHLIISSVGYFSFKQEGMV